MLYVDLAELPALFAESRLWSVDGSGIARLRRADHLKAVDVGVPLLEAARCVVEQATGERPVGPIRLLTHFEYLGYRFNPVSFYYCYKSDETTLAAIIAEINNTPWGEQHCYVLPCDAALAHRDAARVMFRFEKSFHVSPFMPMNQHYDWSFSEPGSALSVRMRSFADSVAERTRDADAPSAFDATLTLRREPWSLAGLNRMLVAYPLMTAQVIGAIYWEALRLWWKGIGYVPHPGAATGDSTQRSATAGAPLGLLESQESKD